MKLDYPSSGAGPGAVHSCTRGQRIRRPAKQETNVYTSDQPEPTMTYWDPCYRHSTRPLSACACGPPPTWYDVTHTWKGALRPYCRRCATKFRRSSLRSAMGPQYGRTWGAGVGVFGGKGIPLARQQQRQRRRRRQWQQRLWGGKGASSSATRRTSVEGRSL